MSTPMNPGFAAGELRVHDSAETFAATTRALRKTGKRIVLVPTMGALHAGHRALLRAAHRLPGAVVASSIFVNPAQFDNPDDFEKYPVTLQRDLDILREEGVSLAFTPKAEDMYPHGTRTMVHPGPVAEGLEGDRDGHFVGVAAVVSKLLNLSHATDIVMGEKDYQQLVIIQQLVTDLNMEVTVHGVPIVREHDGLALSSRNVRLDPEARVTATAISAAMTAALYKAKDGARAVEAEARRIMEGEGIDVLYAVVRGKDLGPAPENGEGRLLVAAKVGGVRLIDNTGVMLGELPADSPDTSDSTDTSVAH